MTAGKSVRIFLADGTPGGLLTAEIMNWTGQVVAAPRSDLAHLLSRPEAKTTGIYVLLGDDPDAFGGTLAYIGEGDDVSVRLLAHSRSEAQNGKDFWDRAVVLTSKDMNLTKSHARYLESRLIAIATVAGRARLTNGTAPPVIRLPEADVSDMEFFISQAQIVLPILGVNIFRAAAAQAPTVLADADGTLPTSPPDENTVFELRVKRAGILATAMEVDGEFTVLAGSVARSEWVGADGTSYQQLWNELVADGGLELTTDGLHRQFSRARVFSSTSAAAAVVAGRPMNGRVEWRTRDAGVTYADWQAPGVD